MARVRIAVALVSSDRRRFASPGFASLVVAGALLGSNVRAQEMPSDSLGAVSPGAPAGARASADSIATPIPASQAPVAPPGTLTTKRKVRLDRQDHNVVRTGPGDEFAIAGVFPKNATFPVIAKSGDWYNVRLSATETGWVHSSLCREYDDLSDLEFKPNPKLYTRTGSFVLGAYSGAYAFDRKSNSLVLGGRVGYYVLDRLQVEGGLGWTHIRRPAEIVESLFGLTLEAEDFDMIFYHLNGTWELLPGRQMVPFLSAGVGSSIMQGETEASVNLGAGTILFLSKRLAMRWEVRDYRFRSGSDAGRVSNDNVEFSLGTTYLL